MGDIQINSQTQINTEASFSSNNILDPLYIAPHDYPGMNLTSIQFNGINFVSWSRQIKRGFDAKHKLGYITGSVKQPEYEDSIEGQKWITCDYLVCSWITNSMKPEFVEAFIHAPTAVHLWKDINDRYEQSSGTMVYQLERVAMQINQGNLSVSEYFNKMKKVWDELNSINSAPICECKSCVCGLVERTQKREDNAKLMQFLMRLNDDYENIRSQIMAMDPLPIVNKAYNMVQQVEKQKQLTCYKVEPTAFLSTQTNGKKEFRKPKDPTQKKFCEYCKSECIPLIPVLKG